MLRTFSISLEIHTESSPKKERKAIGGITNMGQRLACELKSSTAHLLVFLFVLL